MPIDKEVIQMYKEMRKEPVKVIGYQKQLQIYSSLLLLAHFYSHPTQNYKRWTEQEIRLLILLNNAHYSLSEMSKILNRTENAISEKYRLLCYKE